ncbi:MAG: DUF3098 domain-containing protein [Bacteroidaceae bacterium]|nr:DUF3098 domain-containing protein [Bacteroidaceae bacterium]
MNNLAFTKKNYILLAIGMIIIIAGFILMSGSGSTEETFNPEIFSVRRIKVAPAVCFAGFIFIMFGIMFRSKKQDIGNNHNIQESQKN